MVMAPEFIHSRGVLGTCPEAHCFYSDGMCYFGWLGYKVLHCTSVRKTNHREQSNVDRVPRAVQWSNPDGLVFDGSLALEQSNLGLNPSSSTQKSCLDSVPQFFMLKMKKQYFSGLI